MTRLCTFKVQVASRAVFFNGSLRGFNYALRVGFTSSAGNSKCVLAETKDQKAWASNSEQTNLLP